MTTLKDWKAYRSGAGITVEGHDAETGDTVVITGVRLIHPDPKTPGQAVAVMPGADVLHALVGA